jgi:hypothetical protein
MSKFRQVAFIGTISVLAVVGPGCKTGAAQDYGRERRMKTDLPIEEMEYLRSIPPLHSVADTLLACGPVRIEIEGAIGTDRKTGLHLYIYTVINDRKGSGCVKEFAIRNVAVEPESSSAPARWRGTYVIAGGSPEFLWSVVDSGGGLGVAPGDTLFGFILLSSTPPGTLEYRAKVCDQGAGAKGSGEVRGVIAGPYVQGVKRR